MRKMYEAFMNFLTFQAGAAIRNPLSQKVRTYKNIQIKQSFMKYEEKRKLKRLKISEHQKKLIQTNQNSESELINTQQSQAQKTSREIIDLQKLLNLNDEELLKTEQQLQMHEASHVLLEGMDRLLVMNHVAYMQYVSSHPSGIVYNPETIKIVENVHYNLNHNLPINRYKLYEIMPQLFQEEINQLDESTRRLIKQKNINNLIEDPSSRIQAFQNQNKRVKMNDSLQIALQNEADEISINLRLYISQLLMKHQDLLNKVSQGLTPYRNGLHLFTCILSGKLKLDLTPEQQALKIDLLEILDLKDELEKYLEQNDAKLIQAVHSYVEPPDYVRSNEQLMKAWQKLMEKYTNPISRQSELRDIPDGDDGGRKYLQENLSKQIAQKYDAAFVEGMNKDRNAMISKKKSLEIQFYKLSTKLVQKYQSQKLAHLPEQDFTKLPKSPRVQEKYLRLRLEQFTRVIHLNNQDSKKYNLDFFAEYFGIQDKDQFKKVLKYVSFFKTNTIQQTRGSIIKFIL